MKIIYNITQGFCREVAKRARKGRVAGISFAIFAALAVTLYAQSRGTPSTLRIKIDSTGALAVSSAAISNPITTVVFNNALLKVDANGYLVVTDGSGAGFAPANATYILKTANASLSSAQSLGALTTAALINTVTGSTGVLSAYSGVTCSGSVLTALSAILGGTCNASPTVTSIGVGNGTSGAPSLTFSNFTSKGFWITNTPLNELGIEGNRFWTTYSTVANTFTNYPPTAFGRVEPVDTTTGGLQIYGLQNVSANSGPITLVGVSRARLTNFGAISLQAQYFSTNGSASRFLGVDDLFTICWSTGASPCDDQSTIGEQKAGALKVNGDGQLTSNVYLSTDADIGITSQFGHAIRNPVPAAAGRTIEYSPGLDLVGAAWNSSGAASEVDTWRIENRPVSVAGTTTQVFNFLSSIAGGSFSQILSLTSGGVLNLNSKLSLASTSDKLTQINDNANATGMEINVGTPTLGTCTGGTMVSGAHNFGGEVTGNTSGSCIINFGTPNFTNTPICTLNDEGSLTAIRISARSASSITVTGVPSGEAFQFMCLGRIGT